MALAIHESSFGDQELTKIDIDYSLLSVDATPMSEVMKKMQDFLSDNKIVLDKLVKTRRKHIKYLEDQTANKLIWFLFEEFKNDTCITKVDIFSVITDFLDVRPDEFYASLTLKIQRILQKSLEENLGFDVNFDTDKDKLKKLNCKQVSI